MTWMPTATAAALTLNAVRLRRRVRTLPVLNEGPARPVPLEAPSYRLVTVAGVLVPPQTAQAAERHAHEQGLEVLDLVPADLPAERLLDLVRQVDPATYGGDALAAGRSAGHALLVCSDLLERAGVEARCDLRTVELLALATTLKEHAPRTTGLAIAPGLCAVPDFGSSWERHRRDFAEIAWIALVARVVGVLALLVGARRGGAGGWALAAYQAQPLLLTAGTAARPRDRWHSIATRAAARVADAWTTALAGRGVAGPGADVAARRSAYPEVAEGVDRMLEQRRDDCPVCGGTDLDRHTETPDLIQRKPGRFVVDRCRSCRTLFQNPRLTLGGLDFYYRDFYDGLAGDRMAAVFSSSRSSYQGRVDLVASLTAGTPPQRWLDVGTGQGHFCLVARETWPDCVIDGLDFTPNVDLAARRGWIDHAFNGLFPELAPKLEGEYDVVSMHHYLEHTRDPAAELDAAARVVRPGGHLEIEVPNPDSWLGRRLGRYWMPLLQPQHQHLIPVDRLATMLLERGFVPLTVQLAEAHQPVDLGGAAYLVMNHVAPAGDAPWSARPPSLLRRAVRGVVVTALFPVVLVAFTLDQVLAPLVSRSGAASAYRVIARKEVDLDA